MPISITYKNLIGFFCALTVAAMVFSPVLLSISMMGLCALAVFRIELINNKPSFSIHKEGLQNMKTVLQHPALLALMLFFIIALIRFYPIEDWNYLIVRLQIKAPFVLLPLAFLGLPKFTTENLHQLLYFLLVFFTVVSLGILVNYFLHFEAFTELIKKGHAIPTPRNHIRYSLLTAWAIIGGIYLMTKKYQLKYKWERGLIIGLTAFLFIFLHILSVKSGLLVLYVCLGFGLLQYVWLKKQLLIGAIGLAILIGIPFIAYHSVPTFHNKVRYFQYDMFMHKHDKGANLSDSGRIASVKAGWAITKENWFWGIGTANMRNAVHAYYDEHYPNYPEAFMPQNQFLFSWASAGLLGLIGTIFAFFFPLFYRQNYTHPLFLNFYLSIFVIIMIEHALENTVGLAHYLFFALFFLSVLNRKTS